MFVYFYKGLIYEKLNSQFEVITELFTNKTKKLLKKSDVLEDEIEKAKRILREAGISKI